MQRVFARDRVFHGTPLPPAIPIALSQPRSALANMLDTAMIRIAFTLFLHRLGIDGDASIFMARFRGEGEIEGIHRSTGPSIAPSLVACGTGRWARPSPRRRPA